MKRKRYLTTEDIRHIVKSVIEEVALCMGMPYSSVQKLAHAIKNGDKDAIVIASSYMSKYVRHNSILIPISSHTGVATYTLELCQLIAKKSGSKVLDILYSDPRDMIYNMKINKTQNINLGFKVKKDKSIENELINAKDIILVDNVVDTGTTFQQARDAIMQTYKLNSEPWMLSLGVVTKNRADNDELIRSITPTDEISKLVMENINKKLRQL